MSSDAPILVMVSCEQEDHLSMQQYIDQLGLQCHFFPFQNSLVALKFLIAPWLLDKVSQSDQQLIIIADLCLPDLDGVELIGLYKTLAQTHKHNTWFVLQSTNRHYSKTVTENIPVFRYWKKPVCREWVEELLTLAQNKD